MLIGNVIGNVWATKKEGTLSGAKLMIVREIDAAGNGTDNTFVAADVVGAGIGETVLTVSGSTARRAFGGDDVAVDTTIVGIVDSLDVV